jgi:hypothetical protein
MFRTKDFYILQLGIYVYPENASLYMRFGLQDPQKNYLNLTSKSQTYNLEKETLNSEVVVLIKKSTVIS